MFPSLAKNFLFMNGKNLAANVKKNLDSRLKISAQNPGTALQGTKRKRCRLRDGPRTSNSIKTEKITTWLRRAR